MILVWIALSKSKKPVGLPRQDFDKNEIKKISEALKSWGFPKPINVHDGSTFFHIITGEKYWKAAQVANFKEIPVHIHNITAQESLKMFLSELMETEDKKSLLIAWSLSQLKEEYNLTDEYLVTLI